MLQKKIEYRGASHIVAQETMQEAAVVLSVCCIHLHTCGDYLCLLALVTVEAEGHDGES